MVKCRWSEVVAGVAVIAVAVFVVCSIWKSMKDVAEAVSPVRYDVVDSMGVRHMSLRKKTYQSTWVDENGRVYIFKGSYSAIPVE